MNTKNPIDATIAITYRCNSRCRMCNIWQIKNPASLPATTFRNLPASLRYINISGGEPFLHEDIVAVVRTVKEAAPQAQIIISTNGLATELILAHMAEIKKIDPSVGLRISIDGLNKTHDEIRGIPGIFDAAMKTLAGLKNLGITNLGLSFTIMDKNLDELRSVYAKSRELGVELALQVVQNSDIYFQKEDNKVTYLDKLGSELGFVINEELKSWSPKRWARAYYIYGLKTYALEGRRLLASGAGYDSLFIDSTGAVYPSNLINLELGNIREAGLTDIWQSQQATAVRARIEKEGITESWIICTIRGEMRRNAVKVLWWMGVNKLKLIFKYHDINGCFKN